MLNNRDGTNKAPQLKEAASSQGITKMDNTSNSTMLRDSRSRYDKGVELYKQGKVSINSHGLFKVSGYYECDPEKMTCTCPDYRTRKESCKHLFAAMLFVKNRGKQSIEDLPGHSNGAESREPVSKPEAAPNKSQEARSKDFDRQATITRLAVINSAIELLKTHKTPLEPEVVISIAAQLEKWALGN